MITIFDLLNIEEPEDLTSWIDELIHRSTLSEEYKQEAEQLNNPDTPDEVMDYMIGYLYEHQPDRIRSGMNYSMKDIHHLLKKI